MAMPILVALALAAAGGAAAQDGDAPRLVTGSDIDLMVSILEGLGFETEIGTDNRAFPIIRGRVEGSPYAVRFYGCTDGRDCTFIQFTAGWDLDNGISLHRLEEWNRSNVWGQAWRDDEDDPWVGLSVNLLGGVTVDNFEDTADWWIVTLRSFKSHIGWE